MNNRISYPKPAESSHFDGIWWMATGLFLVGTLWFAPLGVLAVIYGFVLLLFRK